MKKLIAIFGIGCLSLTLSGCFGGSGITSTPSPSTATVAPTPDPQALTAKRTKDAKEVAHNLAALPSAPKRYLSSSALRQLSDGGIDVVTAFPTGTKIQPAEKTWNQVDPARGSMDSVFVKPDGTKEAYVAYLVREAGTWKLLFTISTDGDQS